MTSEKRHRTRVPAADPADDPADDEVWEVVWVGDSEPDAAIIASSLRQDGFPAVVRGSNLNRHARTVVTLPGGWGVLVPGGAAEAARDLLERRGEPGVSTPADDLPLGLHLDALRLLLGLGLIVAAFYLANRILDGL